jgi:uncharacterized membrane protein
MEWLRLIGVAVVIVGFALRLRVTVVVLTAGIATGLVAQYLDSGGFGPGVQATLDKVYGDLRVVLATLGKAFVNGRVITLVVLALPALGLLERYGLQEKCRDVIRRIGAATTGRLMLIYHLFRTAVVAAGVRISGHVIFTRPLVVPMALPAARLEEASEGQAADDVDRVKGVASASENYANFFGQNLFFGSPGVALVVKNLADNGHVVSALLVAKLAIPVALASLLLASVQYALLDRWLRRRRAAREVTP